MSSTNRSEQAEPGARHALHSLQEECEALLAAVLRQEKNPNARSATMILHELLRTLLVFSRQKERPAAVVALEEPGASHAAQSPAEEFHNLFVALFRPEEPEALYDENLILDRLVARFAAIHRQMERGPRPAAGWIKQRLVARFDAIERQEHDACFYTHGLQELLGGLVAAILIPEPGARPVANHLQGEQCVRPQAPPIARHTAQLLQEQCGVLLAAVFRQEKEPSARPVTHMLHSVLSELLVSGCPEERPAAVVALEEPGARNAAHSPVEELEALLVALSRPGEPGANNENLIQERLIARFVAIHRQGERGARPATNWITQRLVASTAAIKRQDPVARLSIRELHGMLGSLVAVFLLPEPGAPSAANDRQEELDAPPAAVLAPATGLALEKPVVPAATVDALGEQGVPPAAVVAQEQPHDNLHEEEDAEQPEEEENSKDPQEQMVGEIRQRQLVEQPQVEDSAELEEEESVPSARSNKNLNADGTGPGTSSPAPHSSSSSVFERCPVQDLNADGTGPGTSGSTPARSGRKDSGFRRRDSSIEQAAKKQKLQSSSPRPISPENKETKEENCVEVVTKEMGEKLKIAILGNLDKALKIRDDSNKAEKKRIEKEKAAEEKKAQQKDRRRSRSTRPNSKKAKKLKKEESEEEDDESEEEDYEPEVANEHTEE